MRTIKVQRRKIGGPVFRHKGHRVECGYSSWPTSVVAEKAGIDARGWEWKQYDLIDSFGESIIWRKVDTDRVEARLIVWY